MSSLNLIDKDLVCECPDCGGNNCIWVNDKKEYKFRWACPDCGEEGTEFYEDIYGCMSVPWGFLL